MILSIKNNKKTDNNLPSQAGHWDLHLPDRVSYLPQAVGQSLLSYPDNHCVLDNHWPSPTPIYMACNLPSPRNHPLRCPMTKQMVRTTRTRSNTTASTILQQAHTSLFDLSSLSTVTRCPSLSPFHSPSECGHTHQVSWLLHLNLAATHQHVTVLLPI